MTIALALVFVALFGLAELQAVSNLLALPPYYEALGIGHAVPWALLILGVAAPALFFVVALVIGRGRSLVERALLLAVGLGATHALALSASSLVAALQPALG